MPDVILVRHGSAGSRSRWAGPDHLRPLDKKGRRQAEALIPALRLKKASRVVSSPYLRCVQTVEPLARALGLSVEEDDALAEGQEDEAAKLLHVVVAAGDRGPVVLCSHGDVVPALLDVIAVEGVDVGASPRWAKGSAWVLGTKAGRVVTARYVPPPA